mgnify:CR=1 FL=1
MGIKIKIFAYTGEENISLVDRFFEIVQSFSNTFKSDYFENVFRTGQRTPESWYLWSSMRNMDDIFGYGSDHAVCDKNGNWTIMMPEEVKKEVKKHPEQYAVIKLIYD